MKFLLRSQPPDGNLLSWRAVAEQERKTISRKRNEERGTMMLEVENERVGECCKVIIVAPFSQCRGVR